MPLKSEFHASKVRVYIALKTANIKFSRSIMPFVKFSMGYPQQDSAEFARNNVEVPWKWRRREAIFHDFAPFLPLHYAYEGRFFSLTQRHLSCQTYRFLEDFLYILEPFSLKKSTPPRVKMPKSKHLATQNKAKLFIEKPCFHRHLSSL